VVVVRSPTAAYPVPCPADEKFASATPATTMGRPAAMITARLAGTGQRACCFGLGSASVFGLR
jgi:hypothetical protein